MIVNSSILTIVTTFLPSLLTLHPTHSKTIHCTNTTSLHSALLSVLPGDEIVLAPGLYYDEHGVAGTASHFPAIVNGTDGTGPNEGSGSGGSGGSGSGGRITLRGADPLNPPILSGSDAGDRTVLRIFGDYWTIQDIAVTNGQKGIIFDNANYGELRNCHVYGIGYEGIHVRDGSSHVWVEGCWVHDTGIRNQGFGEGIYVGTDRGSWSRYNPYITNTTLRNNTLGPNIAAEPFDIKEGTQNTLIEFNTVDAQGLSLSNYADSFIDLKSARSIVRYNTFLRNGEANLRKGIAIIYRGTELSAYEHVIHDNYFYLDGVSNLKLVDSYSGSRDIYAFNNVREPSSSSDDDYATIVITECCPEWYVPPSDGNGVCTAPYGLAAREIANTSVVLGWEAVGSGSNGSNASGATNYFLVQYQEYGQVYYQEVNVTDGMNSVEIFDLIPSTVYYWKVSSVCGDSSSAPAMGAAFLTLEDGEDDPPPPPGALQIYTDELIGFWNDYSWGGTYDFRSTEEIKIGGNSIKAAYGAYGGVNLKHSNGGVDASNLVAVRFWVKGDASNGPGNPTLQLRVNDQEMDFEISNGDWGIYQISLQDFGSPSNIEALVIQSRVGSDLLVYIDQIELLAVDETEAPTMHPSIAPATNSPTLSNMPTSSPVTNPPTASPSNKPTSAPTGSPTVAPTASPTSHKPTTAPTSSPSSTPTVFTSPTSSPTKNTNRPTENCVLVCETPPPTTQETPPPTIPPTIPSSNSPSTFYIFDEVLASNWEDFSYKGSFDLTSTEESHSGTTSLRADLEGWGGVNLKTASPGVLLSDLGADADASNVSLVFWLKGSGSVNLRVRVNGKMHDTSVFLEGVWMQVSFPLTLFYDPTSVYQVEIQNSSSNVVTLYFDEISILKN